MNTYVMCLSPSTYELYFQHTYHEYTWSKESSHNCKGKKLSLQSRKEPNQPIRYDDYMAYHYAFMIKIHELESLAEEAKDPRWGEAMNEEMQALGKNNTWDLVPSSPHQKAIG